MNELVEYWCEAVLTDVGIIYDPVYVHPFSLCHPIVCGKPAFAFVTYDQHRVYLCVKHYNGAVGRGYKIHIEGMGWRVADNEYS